MASSTPPSDEAGEPIERIASSPTVFGLFSGHSSLLTTVGSRAGAADEMLRGQIQPLAQAKAAARDGYFLFSDWEWVGQN